MVRELTEQELKVLELLGRAHEEFERLTIVNPADMQMFSTYITQAMHVVLGRPAGEWLVEIAKGKRL